MFTRILVPTDFSTPSDAALAHARRLADATGARLHLLHVVDNMFLRVVLADPRDYDTAALRQLQDRAAAFPGRTAPVLAVERSDEPADEIASYARTHDIDLIVMATHGRGRIAHLLLGSVAEKVARTAPCPVMTLREAPLPAREGGPRLLVATDFSESADSALECARQLVATVGGSIRLLHVMEHTATSPGSERLIPEPAELQQERFDRTRAELSRQARAASQPGREATIDVVFGANAAMITAYAADNGFDMIVMGTRGRSGLAHLVMGSVAESVVRTAMCPVLTVKANRPVVPVRVSADAIGTAV